MDTPKTYQQIIKEIILKYAQYCPSHGEIRLDTVFDDFNNCYALMQIGWNQGKRIRGNLIYITITEDKINIEYDGIETGITKHLIEAGISKDKIVLAFQSPYIREKTKFAVI